MPAIQGLHAWGKKRENSTQILFPLACEGTAYGSCYFTVLWFNGGLIVHNNGQERQRQSRDTIFKDSFDVIHAVHVVTSDK